MASAIADILLGVGAAVAAIYCMVLARRLKRLGDVDEGMGGAIAALSASVESLHATLDDTRAAARGASDDLARATRRAEAAARRLELFLAALPDVPDPVAPSRAEPSARAAERGADVLPRFLREQSGALRERVSTR